VVEFVGDVDEDTCQTFVTQFTDAVRSGQSFIPVIIHSTGGNLFDALKIVALMKSCPVPVMTICFGHAYSAGALLFSAGTEGHRWIGPYATLMLHQASMCGITGTAKEVTNEARELERANEQSFTYLAENTGQDRNLFSDMVKEADGDVYLNAQRSTELNLANHIGIPHLEVQIKVELTVTKDAWGGVGVPLEVRGGGSTLSGKKRKSDDDDDDDDE
jgi:ATP-dependent Clp protease protease subunit